MNKNKGRPGPFRRVIRQRDKLATAIMTAGNIAKEMTPRLRRLANSLQQVDRDRRIKAERVEKKLRAELEQVSWKYPLQEKKHEQTEQSAVAVAT